MRRSRPQVLFPTDRYGVPMLDIAMQADAIYAPVAAWGSLARRTRHKGTWHFYVDDYRFATIWDNPQQVPATNAVVATEVNYSTYPDQPLPESLWGIYRKRWLSRYWQEQGVKIMVDLEVVGPARELVLCGVPRGWRAYSTRASERNLEQLEDDYGTAVEHARTRDVLLLVIGGGSLVQEFCRKRGLLNTGDATNGRKSRRDGGGGSGTSGRQAATDSPGERGDVHQEREVHPQPR